MSLFLIRTQFFYFDIVPAAVCWVVRSFPGFQWFAIVGLDSRLEFSKILRISQATTFKWLRFTLTTSKLHPWCVWLPCLEGEMRPQASPWRPHDLFQNSFQWQHMKSHFRSITEQKSLSKRDVEWLPKFQVCATCQRLGHPLCGLRRISSLTFEFTNTYDVLHAVHRGTGSPWGLPG